MKFLQGAWPSHPGLRPEGHLEGLRKVVRLSRRISIFRFYCYRLAKMRSPWWGLCLLKPFTVLSRAHGQWLAMFFPPGVKLPPRLSSSSSRSDGHPALPPPGPGPLVWVTAFLPVLPVGQEVEEMPLCFPWLFSVLIPSSRPFHPPLLLRADID